jgi:hypothetical protein
MVDNFTIPGNHDALVEMKMIQRTSLPEINRRLQCLEERCATLDAGGDTNASQIAVLQEHMVILRQFQAATTGLLSVVATHEARLTKAEETVAYRAVLEPRLVTVETWIKWSFGILACVVGAIIISVITGHFAF